MTSPAPKQEEFVVLRLCGKDWTFRALDLDQIEQLEPQFALLNREAEQAAVGGQSAPVGLGISGAFLAAIAEVAVASLQHHHAGISVGQVRKLLTLATMQLVMLAVRGISGLQASVPQGEAVAAQ